MKNLAKHWFAEVSCEYSIVFRDVSDYFEHFGAWSTVFKSPFSHAALAISLICWPTWMGNDWSDTVLSVIPSLLGFALAAYALLLAFGDDKFRSFLAVRKSAKDKVDPLEDSILLKVSAVFLHFVIVQIFALLLAIVAHSHLLSYLAHTHLLSDQLYRSAPIRSLRDVFSLVSYFMFVLSICLSADAALNIYHTTRWYIQYKILNDVDLQSPTP